VTRALDVARRRWPDLPPSRLLVRLIETGAQAVEASERDAAGERDRALLALTALSTHYPSGYLDEVRDGWPA
jgi:hypothetical protein